MTTQTKAEALVADCPIGEFFTCEGEQIEELAQDHGAEPVAVAAGVTAYRFDDGSALVVSDDGWATLPLRRGA